MGKKSLTASIVVSYSVHPSVAYARAILENLPAKTGKSLQDWLKLIKKENPESEAQCRAWLKMKHQLGATTANLLAERAFGNGEEGTDPETYLKKAPDYVEEMYSGPKAGLKPLHDALIQCALALGKDVKICPCQTIVPLYRNHVFAEIKPSTKARIDLGLALKNCPQEFSQRLVDTGGLKKGDRITHRIPLASPQDIDQEVKQWLQIAFDLDA